MSRSKASLERQCATKGRACPVEEPRAILRFPRYSWTCSKAVDRRLDAPQCPCQPNASRAAVERARAGGPWVLFAILLSLVIKLLSQSLHAAPDAVFGALSASGHPR